MSTNIYFVTTRRRLDCFNTSPYCKQIRKTIINSRNFGPLPSTFNGLLNSKGNAVLALLPADLGPTGTNSEMVKRWEDGAEVVYGLRAERDENLFLEH